MCSCNNHRSDVPQWVRVLGLDDRRNRQALLAIAALVAVVAGVVGLVIYFFGPTDIDRAEADLKKAWVVVNTLEDDAIQASKDARGHSKRAAEYRQAAEEDKDSTDTARVEWFESSAHGHKKLSKANWERRDNTLHLAAEYRRLLAEAECEILRAKDARDRGTPYKVAPRVREILAPVLGTH